MNEPKEALHQPPAEIINTPQRIAPRFGLADHQPFRGDDDRHGHDVDAHIDADERNSFLGKARIGAGQKHVAHEHAEPLRGHEREDDRQREGLRAAAEEAAQQGRRHEGEILGGGAMPPFLVEKLGQSAERTRGVDVLQGDPRERRRFAHDRDETCREQANGRRDR